MPQSLEIEWSDGASESIELGGYRTMKLVWKPLAEELGLSHLSLCDTTVVIDECQIHVFAAEVEAFSRAFVARYPGDTASHAVLLFPARELSRS